MLLFNNNKNNKKKKQFASVIKYSLNIRFLIAHDNNAAFNKIIVRNKEELLIKMTSLTKNLFLC